MLPELLAPASNLSTALTAFESGADAVYAGLERFNARARNLNFTIEELAQLTSYARTHKKKVYLTFNTLVKENEIEEATQLLDQAASCNPDAVIIQDLGIMHYLKRFLPQLPIHASTQMGIHNAEGVNQLQARGAQRIILERQLTLDELATIAQNTTAELEVFVHGALCCCLSGTCLWSSWMGGHSGNRGRCKQPCRRRYHSDEGNGFFFSTNDLYSLDHIATFKEMEIASLKIEGRMRKADYVAAAVSAYRLLLDAPSGEENRVIKKARGILAGSIGRKWSPGFSSEQSQREVLEHTRLGVAGMIVGDVTKVTAQGFEAKLSSTLKLGDTIRVQPLSGDEGPLLTLTRMEYRGRNSTFLKRGQIGTIFCDKEIAPRSRVYKTGSSPKEVDTSTLPAPSYGFPVSITVNSAGWSVSLPDGNSWHYPCEIANAKSRPATAQQIAAEFGKSVGQRFAIATAVKVDGELFIQQRDIRKCRQAFFEYLQSEAVEPPPFDGHDRLAQIDTHPGKPAQPEHAICTQPDRVRLGSDEEMQLPHPVFPDALPALRRDIENAIAKGINRFRLTSIFHFELFRGIDTTELQLCTSFPLPITNSLAVAEMLSWGAGKVQLWPELEKTVIDALLEKSGQTVELYHFGLLPLLQTRATPAQLGPLQDGRGTSFRVVHEGGRYLVYPDVALEIPLRPGYHNYSDQSRVTPGGLATSLFNYEREMV